MFLDVICISDTWKIIKLKQPVGKNYRNTSWLYEYFNKCGSLESQYQKHGLTINFEAIEKNDHYFDEYLIICRM